MKRLPPSHEKEQLLLPLLVERRCHVIDVGSSYGDYAQQLSQLALQVHCFEPIAEVRTFCKTWLAHHTNITVYPYAVSDSDGFAMLRIPMFLRKGNMEEVSYTATIEPENQPECDGQRYESVEVRRLDGFGFKDVGFIKIDVEGHELAVLLGARSLLEQQTPNLLIEIEDRHKAGSLKSITEMLRPMGYRGSFYSWYDQRFLPVEMFKVDIHQRSQDLMTLRYSNNFIFSRNQATNDHLASLTMKERTPL